MAFLGLEDEFSGQEDSISGESVCERESFGVVVVAKRSQPRLPFYEGKERGASEEPRWENSSRLGGM